MPYTLKFSRHGAVARFSGRLVGTDIAEAIGRVNAHVYEGALRWKLFDLSEADAAGVSPADVRGYAQEAENFIKTHPPYAVAIVASGALEFGMARMYEAYTDVAVKVLVTPRRTEATAWLIENGAEAAELEEALRGTTE